MADPPRYGQPDTTASPLYDIALDYDDNGARAHQQRGAEQGRLPDRRRHRRPSRAAPSRGRAFPGIGPARAATLYWATLQMLTPGSDFVDLAAALQQACTTLAFTPAECATVSAAVDATGLAGRVGPERAARRSR